MDIKNHILFSTCRNPQNMVVVNTGNGSVITTLPIGAASDGAVFNPKTMEAFSSNSDGTLTIVKENSPTKLFRRAESHHDCPAPKLPRSTQKQITCC